MPFEIVKPKRSSRSCTLGFLAAEWIEHLVVHGAGDVVGMPVELIDDQVEFLLDLYALAQKGQPDEGRRLVDEALLLAPKGSDKSGFAARILIFEAIGPCRFGGWAKGGERFRDPWGLGFEYVYEPGEPMGQPVTNPFIRCLATSEDQSSNTYESILYNFRDGPLASIFPRRDNAGITRINLPNGGSIVPSTAAGSSKDGGRESAANADEVHLYVQREHKNMFRVVSRNLRKRAKVAEPLMIATSTWYNSTEESICQDQYENAQDIKNGKVKNDRFLLHYRYGEIEPEDLGDTEKLKEQLAEAYGGATLWMDLDALVNEVQNTRNPIEDSYRYFLNAPSAAIASWIAPWEIARCGPEPLEDEAPIPPVSRRDPIVIAFDGSRKRSRGIVTDATAIMACRVSDGFLFPIAIWEQPADYRGKEGWEVPVDVVNLKIDETFKKYNVVGFFADPALWETHVSEWQRKYGDRLKVKASASQPIHWWMTGGRATKTVEALRQFQDAVIDRELRHNGDPTFVQHVINARRVLTPRGIQIAKETPQSPRKIDSAVAAVLAWQARLQAVAMGLGEKPRPRIAVKLR